MSASDALKTAIASAEAKELHGTRGAYRFERFSFGERGSTLDKDLIVRVGVGLAHQISRLSHPFDYIVAPEPGGHTWGLLTAFLLGTSLRIVRLATEYFEAVAPVTATSAYTIKTFDFSNFQSGDRVVLIDDVISSGGTLRAICAALFSANVQVAGVHCVYAKGPTTALADELGLPIFALSRGKRPGGLLVTNTPRIKGILVAVEGIDGSPPAAASPPSPATTSRHRSAGSRPSPRSPSAGSRRSAT